MKIKLLFYALLFVCSTFAQVGADGTPNADFSEPSAVRWYQSYVLLFAFIPLFIFLGYFIFQYRKKNRELEEEQERLKNQK
jgi:heme/copper-type cytochrome/quinol oxidase subunit 2